MRRTRWSEQASEQLVIAFEEMTGWGESFAARQADMIWEAAEQLAVFPHMGVELEESGERRLFVPGTKYFVYYRVEESVVLIAAVVYAPQLA